MKTLFFVSTLLSLSFSALAQDYSAVTFLPPLQGTTNTTDAWQATGFSEYSESQTGTKEVVLAAHEDAIAYKNGAKMTDSLQAALDALAKLGVPEEKRLDLIIAAEKAAD